MRIGFHLTPFWSPTDRSPTQILDEAIEVVGAASKMGYGWVSIGLWGAFIALAGSGQVA